MGKKKIPTIIDELKKDRETISNYQDDIVSIILDKCIQAIKVINSSSRTEFIYDVPMMITGYPLYDLSSISCIVNNKLKKKGFKTIYIQPNKIYINW